MIYFVCFIASATAAYFAHKTSDRKKFLILSVISILITTLLAGLRAYEIGIDTMSYMTKKRYWQGAVSAESLGTYMKYYMGIGYGEPLFALLCGIVAQTFGNYSVFLLLVHAIIVSGVYIGAHRLRKIVNPAFVLLLFYLVFYHHSLNIMRQYMAQAIVFAALADILKKKYIRYCIAVIVAAMFHTAALLGFAALIIYWFLYLDWKVLFEKFQSFAGKLRRLGDKKKQEVKTGAFEESRKTRTLIRDLRGNDDLIRRRQIILFAGLSLLVLVFSPLCRLAINLGLLNEKYLWYLDMSRAQHTTLITLFLLVEMSALIVYHKYLRRRYRSFDFFFTNSGAYLITHQISLFLVYGKRVAACFSFANLVTIAMIPQMFKDKKKRLLVYTLVSGVVVFYWYYSYILRNASQTYPYAFVFMQG